MKYTEEQLYDRTSVTDESVAETRLALCEVAKDWDYLVRTMEKYPLELEFGESRYVVHSEEGLLEMHKMVLTKLCYYANSQFLLTGRGSYERKVK